MLARILSSILVTVCFFTQVLAQDLQPAKLKPTVIWDKDDIEFPNFCIDQASGRGIIIWSVLPTGYIFDFPSGPLTFHYLPFNVTKKGKLKLGKATLAAEKGFGGSAAFSPVSKNFTVVYDNNRSEVEFDHIVSTVLTRTITYKGKLRGGARSHPNQKMDNGNAFIYWMPAAERFFVILNRVAVSGQSSPSKQGVYQFQLNAKGARQGGIPRVRQIVNDGKSGYKFRLQPIQAVYNKKSKLTHVLSIVPIEGNAWIGTYRYHVLSFNSTGKLVSERPVSKNLEDAFLMMSYSNVFAGITEMHPQTGEHLVVYSLNDQLYLRRIDKKGKTKDETLIAGAEEASYVDIAHNPVEDLYLLVSEVKDGMTAMYIDKNGSKLRAPQLISRHERVRKPVVIYHEKLGEFLVAYIIEPFLEDNDLIVQTLPGKP